MAGRPRVAPAERAQGVRLAARIRELRSARKWTRAQLAEASGVPERTLTRLESEGVTQPGFFTVVALAAALTVSLDELAAEAVGPSAPELVSAGYEGRTIDEFVEALVLRSVDVVADVRLNPISRKPGFSKTRLTGALAEAGISYRHFKELGNPKSNRPPFWEGRPEEGRAVYRALLSQQPASGSLDELIALADQGSVAVLCFEHDEDRCHRKVILEAAMRRGHGPAVQLN